MAADETFTISRQSRDRIEELVLEVQTRIDRIERQVETLDSVFEATRMERDALLAVVRGGDDA